MLTGRPFALAIGLFVAAFSLPSTLLHARDHTMKRIESGPGFVRYALGDIEIVALADGYIDMPTSRLRGLDGAPVTGTVLDGVPLEDGKLRLSVNAFLITDGERRILIDTGASDAWLPTMGALFNSLEAAGVRRDSIDTVALTHTHEDHRGGLVAADGSEAFPNAAHLYVPEKELGMFDEDPRLSRFAGKRQALRPDFQLSTSVKAIEAHGHEVGHTAFEVASKGSVLLIWGDVVHVPSVQFDRPELTWEFDADQARARSTRKRLLEEAVSRGAFIAGAHLDFPGVGSLQRKDSGYSFIPL